MCAQFDAIDLRSYPNSKLIGISTKGSTTREKNYVRQKIRLECALIVNKARVCPDGVSFTRTPGTLDRHAHHRPWRFERRSDLPQQPQRAHRPLPGTTCAKCAKVRNAARHLLLHDSLHGPRNRVLTSFIALCMCVGFGHALDFSIRFGKERCGVQNGFARVIWFVLKTAWPLAWATPR